MATAKKETKAPAKKTEAKAEKKPVEKKVTEKPVKKVEAKPEKKAPAKKYHIAQRSEDG